MKKGFTLAEVLITLGVIGVVAAITLPTLIKNYQKQVTITQLKKAYTDLNQAVKFAEAEYGDIQDWDWGINSLNFFNKYFSRYIKIRQTTRGNENTTYYQISGNIENGFNALSHNDTHIIKTVSGYTIFFSTEMSNKGRGFFIDINGDKKPNTFGKDVFLLYLSKNKRSVIFHSWDDGGIDNPITDRNRLKNGPSVYNYQCNKTGKGAWCGALIMLDGWKIKDDYPW